MLVLCLLAFSTVVEGTKILRSDSTSQHLQNITATEEDLCPSDKAAYIVSIKRRLKDFTKLNIGPVSEAQCRSICSKQQRLDGIRLFCSSVTYSSRQKRCSIHRNVARPRGKRTLEYDSTTNYYEKICLTDKALQNCSAASFYRLDDVKLPNAANEVLEQVSMERCITACAIRKNSCKSIMYFPKQNECVLNARSTEDLSTKLQRVKGESVIYVDNGCALINQAKVRRIHERVYSVPAGEPKETRQNATPPPGVKKPPTTKNVLLPSLRTISTDGKLSKPIATTGSGKVKEGILDSSFKTPQASAGQGGDIYNGPDDAVFSSGTTRFIGDTGRVIGQQMLGNEARKFKEDTIDEFGTNGNKFEMDRPRGAAAGGEEEEPVFGGGSGKVAKALMINNPEQIIPSEDMTITNANVEKVAIDNGMAVVGITSAKEMISEKEPIQTIAAATGDPFHLPKSSLSSIRTNSGLLPTSKEEFPDKTEVESPWSAWSVCSVFHTDQQCLGEQKLGFQSRRCLASKSFCAGPLIRYCAMPC